VLFLFNFDVPIWMHSVNLRDLQIKQKYRNNGGHYEVSTKGFPINFSSIFNKLVIEIKELGDIAGFDLYQKYAAKNGIKINYFKKRVNYTLTNIRLIDLKLLLIKI
jgi:hypothetical protein